jgi:hypothetical protein
MRRLVLAAALALPAAVPAQRASELASVSQVVADLKLTVDYSRPRARGRTGIFGNTVTWGRTWTPGANASTTLAVTRDVTIEGVPVPKGRYSVWIKVVEGPWELLLDKDTTRFHTQPPKADADPIRIPVKRETRPFVEVLTWSVPEVGADGATLVMQWDTVAVPLHVAIGGGASARATSPEAARRVVGRYDMRWSRESGVMQDSVRAPGDTTKVPLHNTFTVRYEGGELRAVMDPPLTRARPGFTDWLLVPGKKGDRYYPTRLLNGQIMSVDRDTELRFDVAGGQARGFEMRTTSDELQATGTRLPDAP